MRVACYRNFAACFQRVLVDGGKHRIFSADDKQIFDDDFCAIKAEVHRLEDLEEKIVWAQEHDAEAQAIAQAGLEFVRDNLRYSDVKQYWRALLAGYGKLLRWKVTKHRDTSEITTASHSVVDREL